MAEEINLDAVESNRAQFSSDQVKLEVGWKRRAQPRGVAKCRLDGSRDRWQDQHLTFPELDRITFDPAVMGGKPCIRGMRVTVGMILGLIASGAEREEILRLYPYLEAEDLSAALAYASWRAEERELPMAAVR